VFADPIQTRVLVSNNYQRCRINSQRGKDFAAATGRVLLAWRRPFTSAVERGLRAPRTAGSEPGPVGASDMVATLSDETVSYFVTGPGRALHGAGQRRDGPGHRQRHHGSVALIDS
jgi:hypothetical protein